jgi:hypothetical protein
MRRLFRKYEKHLGAIAMVGSVRENCNMPVEIGAQAANFADPTSLLSDCHRRIEMFLNVLQKVPKSADRRLKMRPVKH